MHQKSYLRHVTHLLHLRRRKYDKCRELCRKCNKCVVNYVIGSCSVIIIIIITFTQLYNNE